MSPVSPQTLWNALINNGATPVQAAAALGNAYYESSFDPESNAMDTNGLRSYGLWQENGKPGASSLVTGDTLKDMQAQIVFMIQHGGLSAANQGNVVDAASQFAARYEVCTGCQPGGDQNTKRAQKAAEYMVMAQSGNWTTKGTNNPLAVGGTPSEDEATCAWSFKYSILTGEHNVCLLHKVAVRNLVASGLFVGMVIVGGLGALVLLAYGLKTSRAEERTREVVRYIPGGQRVVTAAHSSARKTRKTTYSDKEFS